MDEAKWVDVCLGFGQNDPRHVVYNLTTETATQIG